MIRTKDNFMGVLPCLMSFLWPGGVIRAGLMASWFFLVSCSAVKETPAPTKKEITRNLFQAVIEEDINGVNQLIDGGVDLNVYDSEGYTPLMRVVRWGHVNLVERLIHGGAKVYQPHEREPHLTAFSMMADDDKEIKRIFNREANKYGRLIEDLIGKTEYGKALKISQENFLPLNLILPESQQNPLQFIATVYGNSGVELEKSDVIEYVKYMIRQARPADLVESERDFQDIQRVMNQQSLFDDIKAAYMHHSAVVGPLLSINRKDSSDVNWLMLKVAVFHRINREVPLDDSSLGVYLEAIQSQNMVTSTQWLALARGVLDRRNESSQADPQQVRFLAQVLDVLWGRSQQDSRHWHLALELFNTWTAESLLAAQEGLVSARSSDHYIHMILGSVNSKTYEAEVLRDVIEKIILFYPVDGNKYEKSLQSILDHELTERQKRELLGFISSQTQSHLPQGILAHAIRNHGPPALQLLVESDFSLNPKEHEEAVALSLTESASGELARQMLTQLQSRQVNFYTEWGVKALKTAFTKTFAKDEFYKGYKGAVSFLLSQEPSPLNRMEESEILEILSQNLEFIKREGMGWDLMGQTLKVWGQELPPHHYLISISDFPAFGFDTVKVSLVWDYILTMYQMYATFVGFMGVPKELDSLWVVLSEMLAKFPQESFSMSFFSSPHEEALTVEEGVSEENLPSARPDESLFRHMLPLSLILSIGASDLRRALSVEEAEPYQIHIDRAPPAFSWSAFLTGGVYHHYSGAPHFWQSVAQTLLASGMDWHSRNDKSSIDFIKVMVERGQLHRYPELSEILSGQEMFLSQQQRTCALSQTKIDEAGIQSLGVTSPQWAHIGAFEVLRPLKNMSCHQMRGVSEREAQFVESFIHTNQAPILPEKSQVPYRIIGRGMVVRKDTDGSQDELQEETLLSYLNIKGVREFYEDIWKNSSEDEQLVIYNTRDSCAISPKRGSWENPDIYYYYSPMEPC